MSLKFVSLNARGLTSPYKRKAMWQEEKALKEDVICIQETHFSSANPPKCTHKLFPHIFTANAAVKIRGTLIAIKNSEAFAWHFFTPDHNILICDINNVTYTIVNVYAPNSHQNAFLHKMLKKICQIWKGSLVICGDFNAIAHNNLTAKSNTRPTLQPVLHNEDLYDVWRCLNPTEKDFTYYSAPHKIYTRIDLFVTDLQLLSRITEAKIHSMPWSDHAPISVMVRETHASRPTYMWRNNVNLFSRLPFKKGSRGENSGLFL